MKKFLLLFTILSALVSMDAKAQDPSYLQFFNHLINVNPAYAGMNGDIRVSAIGQHLWYSAPDKFISSAASMDMNLGGSPFSIGMDMQTFDMEGSGKLNTGIFNFIAAYRKNLNVVNARGKEKFSFIQAGFKFGYFSQSANVNDFTFRDQLDPVLGVISPTSSYASQLNSAYQPARDKDFSFGLVLRHDFGRKRGKIIQSNLGFSASHFSNTEQSLIDMSAKLPTKYTWTANANIPIAAFSKRSNFLSKDLFAPSILYSYQGPFNILQFGFNYLQKSLGSSGAMGSSYTYFYGGIWDRTTMHPSGRNISSIVLTAGAQFPTSIVQNGSLKGVDYLKIGFGYDITLGNLLTKTPGVYELSIVYSRIPAKNSVNYYNQRSVTNTISLWLLKNKHNDLARWIAKIKLKKSKVKCPPMFM
jgi:type IX secretion system PorP/SprF family membrane protein